MHRPAFRFSFAGFLADSFQPQLTVSLVTEPASASRPELLQPVLSERWALSWRQLAVCGWFLAFFMYLSYIPLFHSDIWGHVHYGQWILDHRALPVEDPVMPLAAGMRVIDNAWLAQVLFAAVERWAGPVGMSVVFALTVLTAHALYTRVFYRLSGGVWVALAAMSLNLVIGFSRHAIIRPEIFGGLAFALLMTILLHVEPWRSRLAPGSGDRDLSGDAMPRWIWLATPLLFAAWANLHGSFAVGLVALACHALGRGIDVALRQRSLLAPLQDRWFRRLVVLTEVATFATLINPYGLDLLLYTAKFGSNPNLRDVLEWYPLRLMDLEGIGFGLSIIVLLAALRHSRVRMTAADVLLLLVFAVAMAPTVRMIGWYAPVFTLVVAPHLGDVWRRMFPASRAASSEPMAVAGKPNFAPTLIAGLLVWVAFALTPLSQPILGGKPRTKEQVYSKQTPHSITQFLKEQPPEGLVFTPQWWGDWLALNGPQGMDVFMTTNLHLAPNRVWRDYLQVARGQAGWEQTLDRYHVNTLVVHKDLQAPMVRQLRRTAQWKVVYEDQLGIVAQRVN